MAIRAYLNPSIIENFDNVANNNLFLKKENTAFGFSGFVYNKTILPLTDNVWNINNTSETFTYGDVSANTTISIVCSSQSEKEGIEHVLRINNTDNEMHTITISCDNAYMLSPHTSGNNQQSVYTVPANTNIEFRALLYHIDAVNIINLTTNSNYLTASDIINILGYTPYNGATNPNDYITEEDYLQSDWDVTDVLSKAFILNKPDLSDVAISGEYADLLHIPSFATVAYSGSYNDLFNTPNLAPVATSGSYNDLSNRPTIPTVNNATIQISVDGNKVGQFTTNQAESALISITTGGGGSVTPVQSNWNDTDPSSLAYIQNKPNLATVATSGLYSDLSGIPTFASVATSGSYTDLLNKPIIPIIPVNVSSFTNDAGYITSADISGKRNIEAPENDGIYAYTVEKSSNTTSQGNVQILSSIDTSPNIVKSSAIKMALDSKSDIASTVTLVSYDSVNKKIQYTKAGVVYDVVSIATIAEDLNIPDPQIQSDWEQNDNAEPDYIKNKPTFATVATSGNYDDLLNKPAIPTALPSYTASNSDNILAVNHDGNAVEWIINPGEANVQSDWNEADPAEDAYILNKPEIKEYNDYLTFEFTGSTTLKLTKTGSPGDLSLEYSTNMKDWTTWVETAGVRSLNVTSGTKYYFRGNNQNVSGFSTSSYYTFSLVAGATAEVYCSGNLMSIVDASCKQTVLRNKSYRFGHLFDGFSTLKTAPEIKLTDITGSIYIFDSMFMGTGIELPPVFYLSKLSEGCFVQTFKDCTSLLKTATLYAKSAAPYCCYYMYRGDTALTDAGTVPFTTMNTNCCYGMYQDCSNLVKAADILATSASTGCCCDMYSGCINIVIPPVISFTNYATNCCKNMFLGDIRLIRTPLLKGQLNVATALNSAFKNCSSLKEVQITSTVWDTSQSMCTTNWMNNVAATGTFYCDDDLEEMYGFNYIPSGWTVVHVEDTSIEHFDFANEDKCGIVRGSAEYDEDVHTTEIAINPVDGKLYSEGLDESLYPYIIYFDYDDINDIWECSATAEELHENLCLKRRKSLFYRQDTANGESSPYQLMEVIILNVDYNSSVSNFSEGYIYVGNKINVVQESSLILEWMYDPQNSSVYETVTAPSNGIDYRSDWNQNDSTKTDYIRNKPTIPVGLPSQTGNAGKYLTTDGTDASWEAITQYTEPYFNFYEIENAVGGQQYTLDYTQLPTAATFNPYQEKHIDLEFPVDGTNTTTNSSRYTINININHQLDLSDVKNITNKLLLHNFSDGTIYLNITFSASGSIGNIIYDGTILNPGSDIPITVADYTATMIEFTFYRSGRLVVHKVF